MIQVRDNSGNYHETLAIYDNAGREIKEVRNNQGRLLFKNWNEIQGSPPITFRGYGKNLTECRIYGNTVQNGTPSPEAPVDVVGCGVRTRNLFDCDIEQGTISVEGIPRVADSRVRANGFITLDVGTYTLNAVANLALDTFIFKYKMDGTFEERIPLEWAQMPYTFNMSERQMIKIVFAKHPANNSYKIEPEEVSDIMLNAGSAAIPYEPYGYKIPLTVNGTEYPIYLGQVESTRQIKNLVLTGEETDWLKASSFVGCFYKSTALSAVQMEMFCTHLPYISVSDFSQGTITISASNRINIWFPQFTSASTVTEFKQYLAAQYAAGTPVTVWYVLAEPETAIVNEPIQKIGDYSDELSIADIPTINGINTISADTTVQPSNIWIKGKIKTIT